MTTMRSSCGVMMMMMMSLAPSSRTTTDAFAVVPMLHDGRRTMTTTAPLSAQRFSFVASDGFSMQAQKEELTARWTGEEEPPTATTTSPPFRPVAVVEPHGGGFTNLQAQQQELAARWVHVTTTTAEPAAPPSPPVVQPAVAAPAAAVAAPVVTPPPAVAAPPPAVPAPPAVVATPPVPPPPPPATTTGQATTFPPLAEGSTAVEQRNTQVLRAAQADETRWGAGEVQRITQGPFPERTETTSVNDEDDEDDQRPADDNASFLPLVKGSLTEQRNTQVVRAAQAGKSRWGDSEIKRIVWDPLTERPLANGKEDPSSSKTTTTDDDGTPSFLPLVGGSVVQQRDTRVLRAAQTGNSRWGESEVKRLMENRPLVRQDHVPATPNPSSSSQEQPTFGPLVDGQSLVERRNAQVLRAAAAGRSRWGVYEVNRVRDETSLREALAVVDAARAAWEQPPPASTATSTKTPVVRAAVEDADEDLSLFERRNARILEAAAAGTSRWGALEVEQVKYQTGLREGLAIVAATVNGESSRVDAVRHEGPPPDIVVPDASGSPDVLKDDVSLFEVRNRQILNAAAAGKSRWGDFEINKVRDQTALKEALALL